MELGALDENFFERWGRSIPAMLRYFQQNMSHEGPRVYDADQLARISAPLLALLGTETSHRAFVSKSAQHLARHAAGHVRELAGVGHFAPLVAPELLAKELASFFESVR